MAGKTNQRKKSARTTRSAKAVKKKSQNSREIGGILCIVFALFGMLCWVNTDAILIGPCSRGIAGLVGQIGRYILPLALIYIAVVLFKSKNKPVILKIICISLFVLTLSALVHLFMEVFSGEDIKLSLKLFSDGYAWQGGGLIPGTIAELLEAAIMKGGAIIVLLLLLALEALGSVGITVNSLITAIKNRPRLPNDEEDDDEEELDPAERIVNHVQNRRIERYERKHSVSDIDIPVDDPPALAGAKNAPASSKKNAGNRPISPDAFLEKQRSEKELSRINADEKQVTIDEIELHEPQEPVQRIAENPLSAEEPAPCEEAVMQELPEIKPSAEPDKIKKGEAAAEAAAIEDEIEKKAENSAPEYVFPSVSLLQMQRHGVIDATAEMRENSQRLADTLKSFGIEPHIVNVIRGPAITRYEIELDRGVKLSKITNLADDIALSLGATGVRISAIPDKISVVGIEVPNKSVNTVYAREVIDSPAFRNSKSKISFAVGKDISGNCIVGDISKLPHMLIAGTTGSGKSVCMNTLILSLLYKARPEEVKLIMVDPKMVELGVYNGIPHLLIPVVTDPKKAAGALQWTVTEMMRRYRLMSEEGVRDLESYNKAIVNDPDQQPMPQIVVVIDELADLMLVAAKEVEESICRIAQMGRASGIHLVIATQRPSADVITGLMKANIPSRIAFAVSSAMESRIILDTQGAEKLVGKGDMLFAPLGQGKPKRVQGCFITDEEVQAVVNAIKAKSESNYSSDVMEQIEKRAEQSGKGSSDGDKGSAASADGDELLPAAVEVILETGQASVSMLQRRLKLGYARAARIVDEMEERGIVGPFEGAKPRQLLITREQWEQMQNGSYDPNPPVEEEIP